MYAVIETGGKQYKVSQGDLISVEKLDAAVGEKVQLDQVLLVVKDGQVLTGTPIVPGAKAIATVLRQGRGRKIIVFKYKPKKHYRKKAGHRQPLTQLRIEAIEA